MLARPTRTLALALAAFPVLYLVHLLLLEFYSHILVRPASLRRRRRLHTWRLASHNACLHRRATLVRQTQTPADTKRTRQYDPSYAHYASPFGERYRPPQADSCAMPADVAAGSSVPPVDENDSLLLPLPPASPPHNIRLGDDRERINRIISAAQQPVGPYAPPMDAERISDRIDSFAHFKHARTCNISSLDLHTPFSPLCQTKQAVLAAMSGGGRPGYDKPFIPLDCDMRWYSRDQICEIMDRFRAVVFVGDSIMRHIVEGTWVFLRNDVGLGAIADWAVTPDPDLGVATADDCMCGVQTGKRACSDSVIEDSEHLLGNTSWFGGRAAGKSSELICPSGLDGKAPLRVQFVRSNAYPALDSELRDLGAALDATKDSDKPVALVLHTTFWNNVNVTATTAWLEQIQNQASASVSDPKKRPTLFATANAGGLTKLQKFLGSQNNQQLGNLERDIEPRLAGMGIDMLGCYNMSLQATSSDGTHAAFEGNLLKAMSVLNWLDWAGRESE